MVALAIVLSFIAILLFLYQVYRLNSDKPSENEAPVLPRLPIWGSYWFLLWGNYKYPHRTIQYYAAKYKSNVVACWLGSYYTVIATNYQSIKELLSKKEFDGRLAEAYIFKARAFGRKLGVFFTDGTAWRDKRRFTLRYMRDYGFGRRMEKAENDFAEELSTLIDTLKNGPINDEERELWKDGDKVMFPKILLPIAGNFFLTIFTGERFPRSEHGVLRKVAESAKQFQQHSDTTGGAILQTPGLRHFAHGFSFPGFLKGSYGITDFIRSCLRTSQESFISEAERGFVDVCIKRMKAAEGSFQLTEEEILMVGTDFIFPALTANPWAVTNFIKHMMHYPDILQKVQKEIDTVVGRDRLVTLNDRMNLHYTEATIREILRFDTMTPWSVAHRALESGELAGFHIPQNTVLISDLYSMHHDPKFWGDPENLRPERFLTEDGCLGKDHSLPFGAGGRLCAGETFARQFLFLTFSTLIQNFDFGFVDGEPSSLKDKLPGFAESPKDLWIKVTPRK
ncbi:probable cytochrome P450 304a1 [Athalia rosae]|uniref:probable cytochrome P450 304a1 n=1 Tax=Athalia rosae TaxID=37344 RepID=UPI0020335CC2|nr:probable cytochrome P450 304a1 [Athalia rosae]